MTTKLVFENKSDVISFLNYLDYICENSSNIDLIRKENLGKELFEAIQSKETGGAIDLDKITNLFNDNGTELIEYTGVQDKFEYDEEYGGIVKK